MSIELPKAYEPKKIEEKWVRFWLRKRLFHARGKSKKRFSMVIPPPNVTGSLHMGHALNTTLQDILARYKRMKGFDVLWLPGTDHAGIATQNVVERELAKEGKRRGELGRQKFLKKVWEWKKKNGGHIIHQLKRLGASCDWDRERFTMDEGLSQAVGEAFVRLHEEGFIYRDLHLINWCPRCRTALSDLEVEHQEAAGHLWYIRYPLTPDPLIRPLCPSGTSPPTSGGVPRGGERGALTVATTRPETMLGDTAVAVHPEDDRYRGLVGQRVILPLVGREIPILSDPRIDREFGTGAVKVTPAHDFNDFLLGNDHQLPRVNIFTEEGRINENGIHFQGLDRFECRKKIVEELEEKGFLEKTEPHKYAVGHCYRCRTVVEPYLSLQWFVRTAPLAQKALEAVRKGRTRLFPEHWTATYEQWLENIRDWCISRQIWWGHQIPAWYCGKECPPIVSRDTPKKCPNCGSKKLRQDEDVLDTWFSSALWPFSTLGWPKKTPDLKIFYPTDLLVTGFDIIFFWVARMMMMGLKMMGEVPFREVYIHALVRDAEGKKMSKSKGNVIDPLVLMDRFGTDAFRFTLAVLSVPGRDVNLSEQVIEGYRNFMNKIWNASRFYLAQPYPDVSTEVLSPYDRWVLGEWQETLQRVTQGIEGYRFDEAAKALYRFFWHTFCDWYLEFSKLRPNQTVFGEILRESIQALHPFVPFLTEEIWQALRERGDSPSISLSPFPSLKKWELAPEVKLVERLQEVVTALRTIRGENQIPVSLEVEPIFWVEDLKERSWFQKEVEMIQRLARCRAVRFADQKVNPKKMAHYSLEGIDLYVPLEGVVDLEVERKRLEKEIQRLKEDQTRRERKLSDQGFIQHASPDVVAAEREAARHLAEKKSRLEETFRNL